MAVSQLERLLVSASGASRAAELLRMIKVDPRLLGDEGESVSRAVLAQAMNMLLFAKNLDNVPAGRDYVADVLAGGGQVEFDHGALRTVAIAENGALPSGETAFTRFLEPLGFKRAGVYPLDRINMTGRAYAHKDFPEEIAQFFVSELHPDRLSEKFQQAVRAVVASSRDPLSAQAKQSLELLARDKSLPFEAAAALLAELPGCFDRQHDIPKLEDYETLLAESAEMAWISTEGNAFNHATDRVADVFALADAQRAKGRPMKDKIEISTNGRVKQTAFKAAQVERQFTDRDGKILTKIVPGSFYEFITRDRFRDTDGKIKLDLTFDSGNAQGIFKMTEAQKSA